MRMDKLTSKFQLAIADAQSLAVGRDHQFIEPVHLMSALIDVHLSNELSRLLNLTDKLAQQRKDQFISSELFVLAAIDDKGSVGDLLRNAGANKAALEKTIDNVRGGQSVDDPNAEEQRQALEKYTIDLTERAEQVKLDPVIGRDDEIRRTIQVLQRRTKNNPVLIGEPGVGKTAIAEGLLWMQVIC